MVELFVKKDSLEKSCSAARSSRGVRRCPVCARARWTLVEFLSDESKRRTSCWRRCRAKWWHASGGILDAGDNSVTFHREGALDSLPGELLGNFPWWCVSAQRPGSAGGRVTTWW